MARLFAALLLFTACAPARPPVYAKHWAESTRPIDVLISRDMRPECVAAAHIAVDFWEERVDYLRIDFVPGHPVAGLGTITIDEGPTVNPAATAETETRRLKSDSRMLWARVTVAACRAQTIAHELGHGLGLDDDYGDPHNLMWFGSEPGEWGLTEDQLEQVQ